jgi:predicted ATPase
VSPPAIDDEDREILRDLLVSFESGPSLPLVNEFRVKHEAARTRIDRLLRDGYLAPVGYGHIGLTIQGLRACDSAAAKTAVERANTLLGGLKAAYRERPQDASWNVSTLAARLSMSDEEVARLATLVAPEDLTDAVFFMNTGFVSGMQLAERVLDAPPIVWEEHEESDAGGDAGVVPVLTSISMSGYRPFFECQVPLGPLTVIIGANASGKSSLFGAIRFLAFAAANALPPEIDPHLAPGSLVFHRGAKEQMKFELVATVGAKRPLRYTCEIAGPVGSPKVAREALRTAEPTQAGVPPFVFLEFNGGTGVVHDPRDRRLRRPPWNLQPNELALRRALDPTLATLSRFQRYVESWRCYPGFDVGPASPMRVPCVTEEALSLLPSGANLSAVLNALVLRHPEVKEEIETHLASAIPSFRSIGVRPVGKGMAIGVWREHGVEAELTLADLSDGTLRLLAWLTLAFAPNPPPLLCIDEPELGLHPRVLPILAGALRLASSRTQVIVATHSPHFLSQFELDEIGVMRKEGGRAVFLRPASNEALRTEVEEVGSEAIARMFISDELETRP